MTRTEFDARLEELKRHARPAFYRGAALVFAFASTVTYSVLHRFPPQAHSRAGVPWYLGAFLADGLAVGAFLLVMRQVTVRYAPACPSCSAPATWRERAVVLSSGRCPKCGSEFVRLDA